MHACYGRLPGRTWRASSPEGSLLCFASPVVDNGRYGVKESVGDGKGGVTGLGVLHA